MTKAREIAELGDVVTVDGSNVGIGTSSPNELIELSAASDPRIRINNSAFSLSSNTIIGGLEFYTNDGSSGGTGIGASIDAYAQGNFGSNQQGLYLTFSTRDSGSGETNTERMRISSDGSVGIGTSSPQGELDVQSGGSTTFILGSGANVADTIQAIEFRDRYGTSGFANGQIGSFIKQERDGSTGNYDLTFGTNSGTSTNASERMRIDSSGRTFIGNANNDTNPASTGSAANKGSTFGGTSDPYLSIGRANNAPLVLGRIDSDGDIILFYGDGTAVGSIGTQGNYLHIEGSTAGTYGLKFVGSSYIRPSKNAGAISDNEIDLGASGSRFDDIYATNGTIQTSDQNEKQQIASLTDAEITAAKAISKLFKTFKWNDSVAEKGDAARTHTGVIAQQVETAMTDAGLIAGDYAFFISTTWWETQTEVPAIEADEENGVEAQEAYTRTDTYDTAEEAPEGATERNRKGIRYPQLLSFVAAATEQRLASIETRLDALEEAD